MSFYEFAHLQLGQSSQSGHTVYKNAKYRPPSSFKPKKVIYKKNKFGRAELSFLEMAFSKLAFQFLDKNLTSQQHLTLDNNQVKGLCTEHLCYIIEQKEGLDKPFYSLSPPYNHCNLSYKKVSKVDDIPYYFFNELPHAFFARLLKAEQEKQLNIDYASLASILATSYTLEEDDLHKGNFGFYIIKKDNKPYVSFFKIDHDLMFVDSIMSFKTQRLFHFFDGSHAFDVKAKDLLDFPQLTYSANSYWPTRFALYKPWDNKGYRCMNEINAFASLQHQPEFIRAKWMSFYKHILMPSKKIKNSLKACLNPKNAEEAAKANMILQATVARLAQLKAVLFSIKEFRDFVVQLKSEEQEALLKQIIDPSDEKSLSIEIKNSLASYQKLCLPQEGFDEKDTPLHIAIKCGDYRYEESMHHFKEFLNVKNSAGKTPLDVAVERFHAGKDDSTDISKNLRCTIKHLVEHGAEARELGPGLNLEALPSSAYSLNNDKLRLASKARSYQELKTVLKEIGEDTTFCLKSKKILAVACIKEFIKQNSSNPNLTCILGKLKKEIEGNASPKACADLLYIRQLRSKLWIIRQIRGLYGRTSTQTEINHLIKEELQKAPVQKAHPLSFFKPMPIKDHYLGEGRPLGISMAG